MSREVIVLDYARTIIYTNIMNFYQKLDAVIDKNNSLICVGLDSDIDKLPQHIKSLEHPQFTFNKAIIDATANYACAYKPNSAFYEAQGARGVEELKMTCEYIRENYPEAVIILDAKRGDIGNTNNGYVQYAFDYLGVDAITVMPYMGIESLSSFFARAEKGIIVGCHSSNPGSKEFQELEINGRPLYHIVAEQVVKQYGSNPNCLMFMGATYPEQMSYVRKIVGDMTFLVPGVGAQEGEIEKAVTLGLNSKKKGMIINSSRGIIFASSGDDFAQRALEETKKLQEEINKYR